MCRLPSSFLWLLPIFKTTNDATAGTSGFFSCPSPKRSQARSCQPEGDCLAISLEIFWWIMITSIEKKGVCAILPSSLLKWIVKQSQAEAVQLWHCQHPEQLNSYQSSFFSTLLQHENFESWLEFSQLFSFSAKWHQVAHLAGWGRDLENSRKSHITYYYMPWQIALTLSKVTLPVEVITKTAIPNEARTLGTRAN